jgi:hypothetical protein
MNFRLIFKSMFLLLRHCVVIITKLCFCVTGGIEIKKPLQNLQRFLIESKILVGLFSLFFCPAVFQ